MTITGSLMIKLKIHSYCSMTILIFLQCIFQIKKSNHQTHYSIRDSSTSYRQDWPIIYLKIYWHSQMVRLRNFITELKTTKIVGLFPKLIKRWKRILHQKLKKNLNDFSQEEASTTNMLKFKNIRMVTEYNQSLICRCDFHKRPFVR